MWLEHVYYQPHPANSSKSVEEVVNDVEELCSTTNPSDQHAPQLLASAHLWQALHIHKANDPTEFTSIMTHAEEACKVLKVLLAQTQAQPRPSHGRFSIARASLAGIKKSTVGHRKVGTASPLTRRIGNSPIARKVAPVSPEMKSRTKRELVVPAAPTKRGTRSRVAVSTNMRATRTTRATRIATTRATKATATEDPTTPKAKQCRSLLRCHMFLY